MTSWYLDTSAWLMLVKDEEHSAALRRWMERQERDGQTLCGSDLMRTEALRGARRHGTAILEHATVLLDELDLIRLSRETFELAATVDPPELRTLDALHLAVASELGDDLAGIVTYDRRLVAAAAAVGVTTASPGAAS